MYTPTHLEASPSSSHPLILTLITGCVCVYVPYLYHMSKPLPMSNPYHCPVTFNHLPDTVVSRKSAHLQKSAHRYFVLYEVKVYLKECLPWSMFHLADQGILLGMEVKKQSIKHYA